MRYAHNSVGSPPIGVEPQPREASEIASIEISDFEFRNVVTITDKSQLKEVIALLRHAAQINGWGNV